MITAQPSERPTTKCACCDVPIAPTAKFGWSYCRTKLYCQRCAYYCHGGRRVGRE